MKQKGKLGARTKLWVTLGCVALALVLCCIMTNGFLDWNKYCVFGHDYGEDAKCVRCGKDKPIENEPKAGAVFEQSAVFASAIRFNAASNGVSAQSSLPDYMPSNLRPLKVGDKIGNGVMVYVDFNAYGSDQFTFNAELLYRTDTGSAYLAQGDFQMDGPSGDFTRFFTLVEGTEIPSEWGTPEELDPWNYGEPIDSFNGYCKCNLCPGTVQQVGNGVYVKEWTEVPPAPSKTGYTFTGWYTDAACTNKYTAPTVTSDITLYAGFRANTYSIKFNANSGSGSIANESMTYNQSKALTSNAFTKDHYRFKGWAKSANGNVAYSDGQSVTNLTSTDGAVIELFAVWERSEVLVTFVSEGSTVNTSWIAIGSAATLPSNPVKEGYTFEGWYLEDGTKYTDQTLTTDITLTAKFEIIRCTVTFVVDGQVYATYVCDWGTSLTEALKANDVNTALLNTEDEYSRNF